MMQYEHETPAAGNETNNIVFFLDSKTDKCPARRRGFSALSFKLQDQIEVLFGLPRSQIFKLQDQNAVFGHGLPRSRSRAGPSGAPTRASAAPSCRSC